MLDRTQAPHFTLDSDFVLLPIEEETPLRNGTSIYTIRNNQQPVLKIEFVFPAGKWYESTPGMAQAVNTLLLKGTKKKTSQQIAEAFDQLGSHIETQAGFDFAIIALYCLTRNAIPSLELLLEIFSDATFPTKEIEHYKNVQIQNLQVNNEKTSYVASRLLREKVFGITHPYGWEPSVESITSLEQNSIGSFFRESYLCSHIFVAGDSNQQINNFLKQNFINTNPKGISSSQLEVITSSSERSWHVEKIGSTQTSVRLGKKIINRNHPDFFTVLFANHILGGYFGSRLMKNIREEKGLTYGIFSSVSALKRDSFFSIGADVNKENKSLIFDEIISEVNALINTPLSNDEFITAKNHFIGSFQTDMTSVFSHAEKHKNIILNNLPKDYYSTMINRILKTTTENIRASVERYMQPDQLLSVSVG
ncbi:MAG: insulinase family protein [Flammeovirgaceae bacterium]|nr:insulinase family protein [Flammeovirgaceae bacterium]